MGSSWLHGLFSSCREQGLLFIALQGCVTVVVSLIAEHGLRARGLQELQLVGCRVQAQQMWHTGLVALWRGGSSWTRD